MSVSSGGSAGEPISFTCTNQSTIDAAYQAIINDYGTDYLDFDIEMGNAAISAAENTLSQMKAVNGSYTYANVGITPMIGVNDDGSTFTLADASSVASWASGNGIGRLAFWSVDRDQACPGGNGGAASPTCSGVSESTGQFTSAFTGAGGGGGTPPPPAEGPYGGTAAAIPGPVQAASYASEFPGQRRVRDRQPESVGVPGG